MGRGSSGATQRMAGQNVNPGDISNNEEMIVQRGARPDEVDAVLTVARDLNNQYGADGIVYEFQTADMTKSAANVIAYYDGSNIAVNNGFFDNASLNSAYDMTIQQGFHPSRGSKSGMEAVVAHEYGHALTDAAARKMGAKGIDEAATRIVSEARRTTGDRGVVQMAKKISGYATQSNAEAVAEAFSDVYCNGSRAARQSRAIVDVLNSYVKR